MRRSTRLAVIAVLAPVAAALSAAASPWLSAQTPRAAPTPSTLRGIVHDAASNAPLAGTVVTALDSSGAAAGRTIADADGRFSLPVSFSTAQHVARLHVIRIGYQPRDLAVGADLGALVQITMERVPALLDAVRVTGNELCPGSSDRGDAFQLWEQARAGLLGTVVAREAKPATATVLVFEQTLAPDDERVRRVTVRTARETTTRPFIASASPSFFAHQGYMAEVPSGGRIYNAPDADVLLHESFAATHCFRRQRADAAHPDQTGLAFTPVTSNGRDSLVDVAGVIWLDNTAPQLRSLDFGYTALEPAAVAAKAGGHLEFRTMPNGVSFIERWFLRLPDLEQLPPNRRSVSNPTSSGPRNGARRRDRDDVRVGALVQSGGVVLDAAWPDGTVWHDPPTGVRGVVTERDGARPIAHAIVSLDGTPSSTVSADDGTFVLAPVIPGRYQLTVRDTTMLDYAPARTTERTVDVAQGQLAEARLQIAPLSATIARLCRDTPVRDATSIILGRLSPTSGSSRGLQVRSRWLAGVALGGESLTIERAVQTSDVDENGRFAICGAARDRDVELHVLANGASVADTVVHVTAAPVLSVRWSPAP